MIICTILRESKEFTADVAKWFHAQIPKYDSLCLTDLPYIEGVKTSNLVTNFPGWWSKIELFNPDHPVIGNQDLLYFDLDTVILPNARITEMARTRGFTMLKDWYSPTHVNSSIMFIPKQVKYKVWDAFNENPYKIMSTFRPLTLEEIKNPYKAQRLYNEAQSLMEGITNLKLKSHLFNRESILGDQGFIGIIYSKFLTTWSGFNIYSYKKHIVKRGQSGFNPMHSIGNGTLPRNAEIICFHGHPRPFNLDVPWITRFL